MSDNNLNARGLVEESKAKAKAYNFVSSVLYSKGGSKNPATFEVKGTGTSTSVAGVLSACKRTRVLPDGSKIEVPLCTLSSSSNRWTADDLVKVQATEYTVHLARLLADAGYAPLSEEIAVRQDSWLASWLRTLFSRPLEYKAYIAAFLNAMVFDKCQMPTIFICDFSKVKINVVDNGVSYSLGSVLGGPDGSCLLSNDLGSKQYRLLSFHGMAWYPFGKPEEYQVNRSYNLFAKGFAAKSFLSEIGEDFLSFDKSSPTVRNTIVLDVNSVKGLFADEVAKLQFKSGKVFELKPCFESDRNEERGIFVEITKMSTEASTSTTYQWTSVMQVPGYQAKDLWPKIPSPVKMGDNGNMVKDILDGLAEGLNHGVLSGCANRKQVLSYLLAYLPKVRTKKCIMSSFYGDVTVNNRTFEGLKVGRICLPVVNSNTVVSGRNPMLTPAGVILLQNQENCLLRNIYNLSENISAIWAVENCAAMQADDDGDDVAVSEEAVLLELGKLHQEWVNHSLFAEGVEIENDKKGRIVESPHDMPAIVSQLNHSKGDKHARDSDKKRALTYFNNAVKGPEQPMVGLSSDIGVNLLSQISWQAWRGEKTELAAAANKAFSNAFERVQLKRGMCYIPKDLKSLKLLQLYFCNVWICQTSIDWKKRAYRLIHSMAMMDVVDQKGKLLEAFDSGWDKEVPDISSWYPLADSTEVEALCNRWLKYTKEKYKDVVRYRFEALGSFIGSKNAVTIPNLEAAFGKMHLQPMEELFWDIKILNPILTIATIAAGGNPSRQWKGFAKEAFQGYTWDEVEAEYLTKNAECGNFCLLGKLLDKTLRTNSLKKLYEAYTSPERLIKAHKAQLSIADENWREWAKHLEISLTISKNSTQVENKIGNEINLKAFQNFLRLNKLNFDKHLILAIAGIPDITETLYEFAALMDNSDQRLMVSLEDLVMDILDNHSFATFKKVAGEAWQLWDQKPEAPSFDAKLGFAAFFSSSWKNSNFKKINRLILEKMNLKDFCTRYQALFIEGLTSALESNERVGRLLAWLNAPSINEDQLNLKLEAVKVIQSNIARTLRTIEFWGVAKSWDTLKTNSASYRKGLNQVNKGNFTRYPTTTNPFQLVEKLILEKGWMPNDIVLQLSLLRPIEELTFCFDDKEGRQVKGSYAYLGNEIRSYSCTGSMQPVHIYDLVKGVVGYFTTTTTTNEG